MSDCPCEGKCVNCECQQKRQVVEREDQLVYLASRSVPRSDRIEPRRQARIENIEINGDVMSATVFIPSPVPYFIPLDFVVTDKKEK